MTQPPTAMIIPFPVRRRDPMVQSTERLAGALAGLSAALAEQREALLRWREALQTLADRVAPGTRADTTPRR